ncbi:MAG: TRAP transporter small permease [Desulfobacteraceae bacterium]|nr:MAG: TRAP transporter small permease [Desulfobacteraceae bacterium]
MRKGLLFVERVFLWAAMAAVFAMMSLTTADAVWRYVFNSPITGAYEITEKYLMLIAIFLGMSYTYRGAGFIRVTILMDRLPKSVKVPINHLSQLFSIVYCAVLIWGTYEYAVRTYHQGTTLGSIYSAPQWFGAAFIPLGFLLAGIFLLLDLPRVRKGGSALFQEEEGPTGS